MNLICIQLKKILAITFFILVSVFNVYAFADLKSCEKTLKSPLFFDSTEIVKKCYHHGYCPVNVYRLIENISLIQPTIELDDIEVLYIYSRWTSDKMNQFGTTKFESSISRLKKKQFGTFM